MEDLVLEFTRCCRADGMRVSTAEVLDCLGQLDLAGTLAEPVFHTILRANFAKSRREQAAFERLYQLFFHEMKTQGRVPGNARGEVLDDGDPRADTGRQADLEQALAGMAPCETDLDQALMDFMNGRPQGFILAVRKIHDQETCAVQAVKSNLGQLTGRLNIMIAVNRMRQRVATFLGGPYAPVDVMARARIQEVAAQRMDRAIDYLNQDPRPDNAGLLTPGAGENRFNTIGQVPFANLTRDEMNRVAEVVDPWVKKLKDVSRRRFAAARRGAVDVRKTIRRSGRYLGVPVEIIRKDRPLGKGRIVTLCDVSGSVWSTARFMLNILYALQECFARVNSYVFIDDPLEVTDLFLAHDANTAVRKILGDGRLNYNAKTDYGLVFQTFWQRHLNRLDKKTTLIIMGDGRSNYFNPREPVLEALRERCRRLVWLNPEQEHFWGTGDSEMMRYRNHCNEARACGNLNQLIDFFQDLVL